MIPRLFAPTRKHGFSTVGFLAAMFCLSLAAVCWLKASSLEQQRAALATAATPSGPRTKAIEDIKVGDWVMAKDPDDGGPPTPHRVIALPGGRTEHVVHVQLINGGELQATRLHPFWVDKKGWVEAKDLQAGDQLLSDQSERVSVANVTVEDKKCDTYNLTVEGAHTFFVVANGTPVLVHNAPFGNVAGGGPITPEQALQAGTDWLGPGYSQIAPGIYRSADNARQFRMTDSDLAGSHGNIGPHVHYESIGSNGRTIEENSHVAVCP